MKENTSGVMLIGALLIGFVVGYLITGAQNTQVAMHEMPDGALMMNDHGHDSAMESMMHDMTVALEGKKGSEFDQEFLEQMIVHHEGAVVMAQMVLAQSSRPELRALAQDIISTQTKEVQMMRMWQQSWGMGDASVSWMVDDVAAPPQQGGDTMVACTADAKICPDGSAVGRQGPNCEFAKCPGE